MKKLIVFLMLLGLVVPAQAAPHDSIDFDSGIPAGWGGTTKTALNALGWIYDGLGTSFKEVRGDIPCPEDDDEVTDEAYWRQGYYDSSSYTADLSGSATGGAGSQERIKFWHRVPNLDDTNIRGSRVYLGEANLSTPAVSNDDSVWPDFDMNGGITLAYDNRGGGDARRLAVWDADNGEDDGNYIQAPGGGDWVRTSNEWYKFVVDFDVPGGSYSLSVIDANDILVGSASGSVSIAQLDMIGALDYQGPVTRVQDLDNITFESIPEPATMILLSLGGLLLRKRR